MSIFDGIVVCLAAAVWFLVWCGHRQDRKRDDRENGS